MSPEQIYEEGMDEHRERIKFLRSEQIKRTYPRLHRIGKTTEVLLEIVT